MKKPLATITALLGGACFFVTSPNDAPAQQAQGSLPVAAVPAADQKEDSERSEDIKAIRALDAAFTRAYDKGDAEAIAALFTDDAEVTSEAGFTIHGREAIAGHYAAGFRGRPGERIELMTGTIRFLGPDTARETGRARTVPTGDGIPETTRYSVILVQRDGRWLQASVHESPDQPSSPHDRLEELAWLVGEWVDESDEAVVHTSCRWSEDRNYLLRDFRIRVAGQPVMAGSQRIGWDPLTGRFKSWVFDPDGGYSEGLWSRVGKDRWVIDAIGVLADGRSVSATQVLTFVNKGMARWRSVDRVVGGEAVPDLPEIVLVRTPPKPAAPAATPTSNSPRKP